MWLLLSLLLISFLLFLWLRYTGLIKQEKRQEQINDDRGYELGLKNKRITMVWVDDLEYQLSPPRNVFAIPLNPTTHYLKILH